jgi:hypothetical protein
VGGLFFQVIEGPPDNVDNLYREILLDPRHTQVITLKMQQGEFDRIFPEWSMELLDLNQSDDQRFLPLRAMVKAAYDQGRVAKELTEALSAVAWATIKG